MAITPNEIIVKGIGKPGGQILTAITTIGMLANRSMAIPTRLSLLQGEATPVDETLAAPMPTGKKREIQHHPEPLAARHYRIMSGLTALPETLATSLSQSLRADREAEARAMVEADHVQASAVVSETIRIPVQQLPTNEIRQLAKLCSLLQRQVITRLPLAINQAAHGLSR